MHSVPTFAYSCRFFRLIAALSLVVVVLLPESLPAQTTPRFRPAASDRFFTDHQGTLHGQVCSPGQDQVGLHVLLMSKQQRVSQVQTAANGTFQFQDVAPGEYSLVIAGPGQFAGLGVVIKHPDPNLPDEVEADVGADTGGYVPIKLSTISTNYRGVQMLTKHALPNLAETLAANQSISNSDSRQTRGLPAALHRQIRTAQGGLHGRIRSLLANEAGTVQVFLIQQDRPMFQVQSNTRGEFVIPDVTPGTYDLVAVGRRGFAALRIDVVENPQPMKKISFSGAIATELNLSLAKPIGENEFVPEPVAETDATVRSEIVMEPAYANLATGPMEYASESMAYGCAAGGTGGAYQNFSNVAAPQVIGDRIGGSFVQSFNAGPSFGGLSRPMPSGGGLGRLLRLGTLAGAIVAIADDDPRPASPVID